MNRDNIRIRQEEDFAVLWHNLLHSNKLSICTGKLEGVTPLEVSILRLVGENPEIILREICKRLSIVSSTLTSAVNRLEKRNLLKRTITSRDLRSFGLELTEVGKSAVLEHVQEEKKIISKMLDTFDNEVEKNEFIRLFKKLVEGIV